MKRFVKEYANDILSRYNRNTKRFIDDDITIEQWIGKVLKENEHGMITDRETIKALSSADDDLYYNQF